MRVGFQRVLFFSLFCFFSRGFLSPSCTYVFACTLASPSNFFFFRSPVVMYWYIILTNERCCITLVNSDVCCISSSTLLRYRRCYVYLTYPRREMMSSNYIYENSPDSRVGLPHRFSRLRVS